jgi:hypothetical protein
MSADQSRAGPSPGWSPGHPMARSVRRATALALGVSGLTAVQVAGAERASADPCTSALGAVRSLCPSQLGQQAPTGVETTTLSLNPLDAVAGSCAKAASWVINKLGEAIESTTSVDFTNPGFMRQYAIVFAASTVLTLILWLLAVAKRAMYGVPVSRAVSEAIGFLWLAVLACAFTPVVLALLVSLTDAITDAIASGTRTDTREYLSDFAKVLDPRGIGGGPIASMFVSLLALIAAAVIWVELLIRAAMLYVGAILGTIVYAGLVDRDLWHHVRRWAGLMVAIILIKPIVIIVLSLATTVAGSGRPDDTFSAVLTGLAIMFLTIFASVMIYKFVPSFGDDMAQMHASRQAAGESGVGGAARGPASYMRAGIATHGNRGAPAKGGGNPVGASTGAMAAGVVAHAGRGAARTVTGGSPKQSPPPPPPPPPPPQPPPPKRGSSLRGGPSS